MNTTTTLRQSLGLKPKGWCEEQGVAHAWESGPTLTVQPPVSTRICKNCGKHQHQRPPEWLDAP